MDLQPPRSSTRADPGKNAEDEQPLKAQRDRPPHMADPGDADAGRGVGDSGDEDRERTHPYASIPDAINAPALGQTRPAAREPAAGRPEPAYATSAKIQDPRIAKAVYERAMETPITVTHRELLSLAPEVRAQMVDATVKKRVPREPVVQAMVESYAEDEEEEEAKQQKAAAREERRAAHMPAAFVAATRAADPSSQPIYSREPVLRATIEEIEDEDDDEPTKKRKATASQPQVASFIAKARSTPVDSTVTADPSEAYLQERTSNGNPTEGVIVAAESNALRAILPLVDGQDRVEAILDPGCQIIAMSEEISNALAIAYDPAIRLTMVSANGGQDQSLGLARNVPFLVGDITLYLQVHVLRKPAYDILLGRPFDVLTRSVVRNSADENQTVTIIDPNTGHQATVPTIERGSHRFADRRIRIHKCPRHSQARDQSEQDF